MPTLVNTQRDLVGLLNTQRDLVGLHQRTRAFPDYPIGHSLCSLDWLRLHFPSAGVTGMCSPPTHFWVLCSVPVFLPVLCSLCTLSRCRGYIQMSTLRSMVLQFSPPHPPPPNWLFLWLLPFHINLSNSAQKPVEILTGAASVRVSFKKGLFVFVQPPEPDPRIHGPIQPTQTPFWLQERNSMWSSFGSVDWPVSSVLSPGI